MLDLTVALILAGLTSVWRYIDGSDKRPKGSNLIAFAIVLAAGLWVAMDVPFQLPEYSHHKLLLLLPCSVAGWLLIRGMPGWTEWKPMLMGFGLPTAIAVLPYVLLADPSVQSILFAVSGSLVALTYVGLSKLEARLVSLPGFLTAEKWGRLSYGFIIFSLALL